MTATSNLTRSKAQKRCSITFEIRALVEACDLIYSISGSCHYPQLDMEMTIDFEECFK